MGGAGVDDVDSTGGPAFSDILRLIPSVGFVVPIVLNMAAVASFLLTPATWFFI